MLMAAINASMRSEVGATLVVLLELDSLLAACSVGVPQPKVALYSKAGAAALAEALTPTPVYGD